MCWRFVLHPVSNCRQPMIFINIYLTFDEITAKIEMETRFIDKDVIPIYRWIVNFHAEKREKNHQQMSKIFRRKRINFPLKFYCLFVYACQFANVMKDHGCKCIIHLQESPALIFLISKWFQRLIFHENEFTSDNWTKWINERSTSIACGWRSFNNWFFRMHTNVFIIY